MQPFQIVLFTHTKRVRERTHRSRHSSMHVEWGGVTCALDAMLHALICVLCVCVKHPDRTCAQQQPPYSVRQCCGGPADRTRQLHGYYAQSVQSTDHQQTCNKLIKPHFMNSFRSERWRRRHAGWETLDRVRSIYAI